MTRLRKHNSSSTRGAIVTVLIVAAAMLLFPREWKGGLARFAQVLIPFQHAAASAADSLSRTAPGRDDQGMRSLLAAEHRAAAFAARVQQLESDVKLLTATRLWDINGRKIGARGSLIPARIITEDLLPWRSSRLVDAGRAQGVSSGEPVISDYFTVDRGTDEGARLGLAIVAGEALIGFVDYVTGQSTRVRLLSDPQSGVKVRIGRVIDQTLEGPDRYFWLTGSGPGRMEIQDAEMKDAAAGLIRPGDLVLSDPEHELLPAALVIGHIESIEENRDKPLFAVVHVQSAVRERSLRRVYIYDPGGEEPNPP